jgi:hypothetical protein
LAGRDLLSLCTAMRVDVLPDEEYKLDDIFVVIESRRRPA